MSDKREVTYTLAQVEQWQVFTGEPEEGGDKIVGMAFEIEGVVVNLVMTPLMGRLIAKSLVDAANDCQLVRVGRVK